jgi:uncharacterized protein
MSEAQVMLHRLREVIRAYGSVVVAYSGGVDSAVILRITHDVLGDRALGCIGKSPALPDLELASALSLAEVHGLPVRVIDTDEYLDPNYTANNGNRCFHCRDHLFRALRCLADEIGFAHIADGVHLDDQTDHVGGIAAARKHGVRSPFLESHLNKSDVRAIAQHLHMEVWRKPAMACLASRIPQGTPVTLELLNRIDQAEAALSSLGFRDFRVRHHGQIARLELCESDFPIALQRRDEILHAIQSAGYRYVTLDLCARSTGATFPPDPSLAKINAP